jgi:cell wall-associated NlpC family hydrolase
MIPAWVAPFVDIPWQIKGRTYDGCDCWGLLRLVMQDHFGIAMPSYTEAYPDLEDGEWIATLLRRGIAGLGWTKVDKPREGDGVLLRVTGKLELHVGLVTDREHFLHTFPTYAASVCDRFDHSFWSQPGRVLGYYRHPAMA